MPLHPPLRVLAACVLAGLAFLLAACASTKPRDLTPVGVLDVRFVEVNPAPGVEVEEFAYKEVRQPLGPAHTFGLSEVGVSTDGLGRPALYFRIQEQQAADFRALTESSIGRSMAMLVDDEIITIATVNSVLPGSGQIEGEFDLVYVEGLIASITGDVLTD